MSYPKHIPGTWQFNGEWLGSYRLIASDQDLGNPYAEYRDITCPICEYPEALRLPLRHQQFPLHYYCPECGTIFQWYGARCPDCDGDVWRASHYQPFDCPEGMVRCSMCKEFLNIDFVKYVNEDIDFHNEYEED